MTVTEEVREILNSNPTARVLEALAEVLDERAKANKNMDDRISRDLTNSAEDLRRISRRKAFVV